MFWLFFKIEQCSAISFKRSRRELSIDVAEHRSILKSKGVVRILVIFQDRPISFKRSRRELSINVAEHRSILKALGQLVPKIAKIRTTPVLFPRPIQVRTL